VPPDETEPPEEDDAVKPRTYTFDPLEAERNIKVGNFYMHRGRGNDYRAAAGRFEDATKYDPKSAEAFFRLGEAEEKLKHKEKAGAAFHRVVELSPDSKLAKEAQKKLAHRG
jgi:tetratricopeptide (TPR) repeat protein